jgi:glycosyltransferase involved in cell wall biosynthesis
MNAPLVSVIMPVYNATPYVGDAVQSVLAQTLGDLEVIAIDDASTDDSRRRLEAIVDPRLRVLANAANLGAADTKNRGLSEARGEYIAFLDADDLAAPQRLATQIEWLRKNPSAVLAASSLEHIDGTGRSLGIFDLSGLNSAALRARLLFKNRLAQSTVTLRREALGTLRFRREFEPAEDYDLWTRLAPGCEFAILPEVLVRYRVHEASVSALKHAAMERSVAAIHRAQLAELGLTDDTGIHEQAVSSDPIASLDLLARIDAWLVALQNANRTIALYDAAAFDAELRHRWLNAGLRSWQLGFAGWNVWRRSIFASQSGARSIGLLGRALRQEFARFVRRASHFARA